MVKKPTGNHLIKPTLLEENQSSVFGFNRVWSLVSAKLEIEYPTHVCIKRLAVSRGQLNFIRPINEFFRILIRWFNVAR